MRWRFCHKTGVLDQIIRAISSNLSNTSFVILNSIKTQNLCSQFNMELIMILWWPLRPCSEYSRRQHTAVFDPNRHMASCLGPRAKLQTNCFSEYLSQGSFFLAKYQHNPIAIRNRMKRLSLSKLSVFFSSITHALYKTEIWPPQRFLIFCESKDSEDVRSIRKCASPNRMETANSLGGMSDSGFALPKMAERRRLVAD